MGAVAPLIDLIDDPSHRVIDGAYQLSEEQAKAILELRLHRLTGLERGKIGDDPVIYYTDPMKLLNHLNEVHGTDAVNGMAGLMAWCQAPTRALGRGTGPTEGRYDRQTNLSSGNPRGSLPFALPSLPFPS